MLNVNGGSAVLNANGPVRALLCERSGRYTHTLCALHRRTAAYVVRVRRRASLERILAHRERCSRNLFALGYWRCLLPMAAVVQQFPVEAFRSIESLRYVPATAAEALNQINI